MTKKKGDKELPGQWLSVERPAKVNPARYHEPVLGEDGDRILIVGYTVSKWFKLDDEKQQDLEELGFVLPKESAMVKAMNWLEPQPEPESTTTGPATSSTTTQANPQQPSAWESWSAPQQQSSWTPEVDYEAYVEPAEWDTDVDGQSFTLRNPGVDLRPGRIVRE